MAKFCVEEKGKFCGLQVLQAAHHPGEESGRCQSKVRQEEMLLTQSCKECGATALSGIQCELLTAKI